MKGLNEFLNESELSESKREVGKYYNAARKAGADNLHLEKTEPDYTDKVGASFTFTSSDGDWVEIYYNKKKEKDTNNMQIMSKDLMLTVHRAILLTQ